jgi:hypothetical protein
VHRATPIVVAGSLLVSACVVGPPAGPSVMALPPQGKDLAVFQADDANCRQYALQQIGYESPDVAAQQSGIASAAIGTVLGAAAGAAIGAAAGNPAMGAAIGAGSGLALGGAAGVNAAQISGASVQYSYDIGYAQCMASKGNSVPPVQATATPYGYPPYPYPYAYYPPPAYYGPPVYVGFGWGGRRWR